MKRNVLERKSRYLSAVLALVFTNAWAQEAPSSATPASAPSTTLAPVRITGTAERETATTPVNGYRAKNATTGTKTDTPLAETPQSITIVTRDQITDQAATNLQDALNYSVGVRSNAYGIDSRSDGFRVRGGYPDEYLDGLRKNFDYYTSNARTEPYTLERIEILRGPSSMLFGQSTTGGVVNMVSKRPQAERAGEVGLQIGSFNRKQLQLDLTGPIDDGRQWLYRLVVVGRDADTQVDHVRDDRKLLAPSLTWQPLASTSVTLQALWQKDKTGSTSQFFPWDGTVSTNPNGRIPTHRFIGDPEHDGYDTERKTLGYLLEHRFNEAWAIRQNVRYTKTDNEYASVYGDSFVLLPGGFSADPVNRRLLGRFSSNGETHTRLFGADQNIEGRFATGPVSHVMLLGVDYARYRKRTATGFDFPEYLGGSVPLIDVFDPVYIDMTPAARSDGPTSKIRQTGVYLQDQLRFAGGFIATLGLRHDDVTLSTEDIDDTKKKATTKRAGLLYAFANGFSPYVSYSESFTPLANNGSQQLKPLRGKQWEAGVKFEPPGAGFAANAAVYTLQERNQLGQQDPVTLLYAQADKTRAKGVELEFRGSVTQALDLIGNYTYTDVSAEVENVPAHEAQLWARYRFAVGSVGGFSAGAGVRYARRYHDGNAPEVPSTVLLDLLAAWDNGPWRLALNIQNATDKTYVSTCLRRGDCWYGTRRNVIGSVAYRF